VVHVQAPVRASEKENILMEEEEETRRISSKEYSKDNVWISFFYTSLEGYFFETLKNKAFYSRYFSSLSIFGSPGPGFSVLRL
jgi:hypothetical protein